MSDVANRLSSTTLSIPISPEEKASEIRGNPSRAWEAAIHRWAFHSEMPRRILRKWAMSLAPESFHASIRSASAV